MREASDLRRETVSLPFPPGEENQTGAACRVAEFMAGAVAELATRLDLPPREARLEAQVLAAHGLGVERTWLIAHDRDPLPAPQASAARRLLARRLAGEPVAYILGWREFYGRPFRVSPAVLIPRPETELLVEAALAGLPEDRPADVLDLGTGSGCVGITLALERPGCRVTAVDVSPAALAVAHDNVAALGARLELLDSDWFSALAGRPFDLIVGNPPYVADGDTHLGRGDTRFEPVSALAAGPDGLDDIRGIIAQGSTHLAPGGRLLLEHGWTQSEAVRALFTAAGYEAVQTLNDLAGLPRVTGGSLPKRPAARPPGG